MRLCRFQNTRIFLALMLCLGLVTGCATLYEPVPEDYTGPKALVLDSVFQETINKGQFFVLAAIDGHPIETSLGATRKASSGQGFLLTISRVHRKIPAKPMRVKLVATHATAAPILEISGRIAGTFFSVEGEVEFVPQDGGSYAVTGELKKEGSSVWIEDSNTKQPVTEKVTGK
jgi:hypothetical protein